MNDDYKVAANGRVYLPGQEIPEAEDEDEHFFDLSLIDDFATKPQGEPKNGN